MKLTTFLKTEVEALNNQPAWSAKKELIKSLKQYSIIFNLFLHLLFKDKVVGAMLVFFLLFILSIGGFVSGSIWAVFRVIFYIIGGFMAVVIFFGTIAIIGLKLTDGFRKRLIKKYKEKGMISFSENDYNKSADILRKFKKIKYQEAIEKYGQENVDLLLMTRSISFFTTRGIISQTYLEKAVSIKSIEKNIEAGEGE